MSTLRKADRLVVLERGRIAEIGQHQDLIQAGGVYARLHRAQQEHMLELCSRWLAGRAASRRGNRSAGCAAVERELSEQFAEDAGELEAMPRETGGQRDAWVFGMAIENEVAVGRHRVHADGVRGADGRRVGQKLADELGDALAVGRIVVSIHR